MKQVLFYSIQSEPIANILNGLKTIEVRKRDLPQWAKDKLARGEKVIGYGYCTKGKPYLIKHPYHSYMLIDDKTFDNLNGLVVVKFEVSGSEKIYDYHIVDGTVRVSSVYETDNLLQDELLDKACLTLNKISNYVGMNDSYAHHLTNITPIEPMGIGEFYGDFTYSDTDEYGRQHSPIHLPIPLKRPPQSFQTVWVKGE